MLRTLCHIGWTRNHKEIHHSGGMDELIDSVEECTGKNKDGTEKEVNRSREDMEMEQRDRLRKDKASKDLHHDKEQTVSPEELSLESTSTRHQTQRSNSAFEENQLQVSSKPSLSFVALIAKAILSSASKKLNLSSIYTYIEEHFLYFKTTHKGWRNSIRHNLSLNDCFVKLGRCEDGKGHYWGIHPAHVADFHRGDFRQHRKANRRRQLRVHSMTEASSWMAQCSLLEYWSSGAAAGGWVQMGYPWEIAHPWSNAVFAEWMYYPNTVYFNGLQSFGIPEVPLCRVNGIYTLGAV